MSDPNNAPKIIVDEDWKSQVEREREETNQAAAPAAAQSPAQTSAEPTPIQPTGPDEQAPGELPPASFGIHISSIATQILVALGQLDDPIEGKPRVNLKFAKFQIDILSVLEEKTKGNVTEEEATMLRDALHQLRMMFVAVGEQLAGKSE